VLPVPGGPSGGNEVGIPLLTISRARRCPGVNAASSSAVSSPPSVGMVSGGCSGKSPVAGVDAAAVAAAPGPGAAGVGAGAAGAGAVGAAAASERAAGEGTGAAAAAAALLRASICSSCWALHARRKDKESKLESPEVILIHQSKFVCTRMHFPPVPHPRCRRVLALENTEAILEDACMRLVEDSSSTQQAQAPQHKFPVLHVNVATRCKRCPNLFLERQGQESKGWSSRKKRFSEAVWYAK